MAGRSRKQSPGLNSELAHTGRAVVAIAFLECVLGTILVARRISLFGFGVGR